MKSYPRYDGRTVHCLDGTWDFGWLGADCNVDSLDIAAITFDEKMPVPSAFDAFPSYAGMRGVAAYRNTVNVTPGFAGILECGGLGMWNAIYIDGEKIADAAYPYSGVRYQIPPSGKVKRDIVIVSDNRFSKERVPLQEQYFDFYAYGGIFRSLYWHEVGAWWIDRV